MTFSYVKIKKKMDSEETTTNDFRLSHKSRQRNRAALRTIKGLVLLFAVTVILVRILSLLNWGLSHYMISSQPSFGWVISNYIDMLSPFLILNYFMNNILNIFIYAKMIPDFRDFVLKVHTFGFYKTKS